MCSQTVTNTVHKHVSLVGLVWLFLFGLIRGRLMDISVVQHKDSGAMHQRVATRTPDLPALHEENTYVRWGTISMSQPPSVV